MKKLMVTPQELAMIRDMATTRKASVKANLDGLKDRRSVEVLNNDLKALASLLEKCWQAQRQPDEE